MARGMDKNIKYLGFLEKLPFDLIMKGLKCRIILMIIDVSNLFYTTIRSDCVEWHFLSDGMWSLAFLCSCHNVDMDGQCLQENTHY